MRTAGVFLSRERIDHHEAAGEWPCAGVSEVLAARLRDSGNAFLLVDGGIRLTFRDFAARVERLAAGLARSGVAAGDVVSWQLPSWWEAAVLAVALDRLGAVSNPILPIYRESEVAFIARESSAKVLVVPGRFRRFDHRVLAEHVRRQAPSIERVVVVRDRPGAGMTAWEDLPVDAPAPTAAERDPYAVSTLFYTSGTTSDPKGVMHSSSTLGAFARSNAAVSGGGPKSVSLLQFPLTHIGGLVAFVFLPILERSRVVYLDTWDPERALALIESEGVTSAGGPPAILQGMLAAKGFSPERVRSVRSAGTGAADVPPELIREVSSRFGVACYRSYGLTECPMLTSGRPGDPQDKRMHTDGRPSPGCRVRIVDDDGNDVGPEREGEIHAFGPQLCIGYLNPDLTREAFTRDGFLRTGDLGIVDADGHVRVTGRKKDIIIRKGENLSAKAIEDVLHEHPAVADAAVIGLPDPGSGERVCACVVLRAGVPPLALSELRAFMEAKQVMKQKIPEQIEIVDELPRNATGKVKKFELRARFIR
jgi:cyclohexanecarboxylate-CoA ligase